MKINRRQLRTLIERVVSENVTGADAGKVLDKREALVIAQALNKSMDALVSDDPNFQSVAGVLKNLFGRATGIVKPEDTISWALSTLGSGETAIKNFKILNNEFTNLQANRRKETLPEAIKRSVTNEKDFINTHFEPGYMKLMLAAGE